MKASLICLVLLVSPAAAGELEESWNNTAQHLLSIDHTFETKCDQTFCTYTLSAKPEGHDTQMIRVTHRDGTEELILCWEGACNSLKDRVN